MTSSSGLPLLHKVTAPQAVFRHMVAYAERSDVEVASQNVSTGARGEVLPSALRWSWELGAPALRAPAYSVCVNCCEAGPGNGSPQSPQN